MNLIYCRTQLRTSERPILCFSPSFVFVLFFSLHRREESGFSYRSIHLAKLNSSSNSFEINSWTCSKSSLKDEILHFLKRIQTNLNLISTIWAFNHNKRLITVTGIVITFGGFRSTLLPFEIWVYSRFQSVLESISLHLFFSRLQKLISFLLLSFCFCYEWIKYFLLSNDLA